MLKTVAVVLVLAVAAMMVYAGTRPDSFRVERSVDIKAPPDRIYPHISRLRAWSDWSPYERKDPAMKRTFSGPPAGPGAIYAWEGNGEVGVGRMEIAEAVAPSDVRIKLDFDKPFEAHNIAEFTLRPQGDVTRVTWSMRGPVPYLAKLVHLVFDMDRMVGGDFEAGLANLKALAEK